MKMSPPFISSMSFSVYHVHSSKCLTQIAVVSCKSTGSDRPRSQSRGRASPLFRRFAMLIFHLARGIAAEYQAGVNGLIVLRTVMR